MQLPQNAIFSDFDPLIYSNTTHLAWQMDRHAGLPWRDSRWVAMIPDLAWHRNDLAWHRKNITKPMQNGHVPDWLGLDWHGLGLGPDRTTLDGIWQTLTKPMKNACPHILCGHAGARFTFSAGTRGLTSHVGSARPSPWTGMALAKTLQN